MSHAASAYYPSPYADAVTLTMDRAGEWATTSAGFGRGEVLQIQREIHFPHSLGLLYSAFTYYTGFEVNSGEYKVMRLAPYGEPKYAQTILDNLLDLKEDGLFRLNQSYFNYCTGLTMTNRKFDKLFAVPPRAADAPVRQRDMDLAASCWSIPASTYATNPSSVRRRMPFTVLWQPERIHWPSKIVICAKGIRVRHPR